MTTTHQQQQTITPAASRGGGWRLFIGGALASLAPVIGVVLAIGLFMIAAQVDAATRFYFPTTEAPTVSPSFQTGWDDSSEGQRRVLRTTKDSDAITVGQTVTITEDTGNEELDRQFVSAPLAAGGTFTSGVTTVSMQLMVREYAGTDDVNQCILGIRVMSEDGTSVQATLLAVANYGTTTEFINNATHRNHTCADGDTVTASYTTVEGDRLVVEVGYKTDGAETTPQASAKWGDNATDLPANDTQTTNGAGWIEFSNTIELYAPPVSLSGTLYEADGTAAITSSKTIKIAVGTTTPPNIYATSTLSGSGAWQYHFGTSSGVTAGTPFVVWVDGDAVNANVVYRATTTGTVTGLDLYRNHVIVRTGTTTPATYVSTVDMDTYDNADDTDLMYLASTTAAEALTVYAGTKLLVWDETQFVPGGGVTIRGMGSSTLAVDGSLELRDGSAYVGGADDLALAGSLIGTTTSYFFPHATGTYFMATTTGKVISGVLQNDPDSRGGYTTGDFRFAGAGGGWTLSAAATTSDITVVEGTLSLASPNLVVEGDFMNHDTVYGYDGEMTFATEQGWSDLASSSITFAQSVAAPSSYGDSQVVHLSPDGTKLFQGGGGGFGNTVIQFTLTTPWDLTTRTATTTFEVGAQTSSEDPSGLDFSPDGKYMFVLSNGALFKYSLEDPWDISTTTYTGESFTMLGDFGTANIIFRPDGMAFYSAGLFTCGSYGTCLTGYNLSVPWDITTATLGTQLLDPVFAGSTFFTLYFKPDGRRLYLNVSDYEFLVVMDLETPWDISTAVEVNRFGVASVVSPNSSSMHISPDGRYLYVGEYGGAVFRYDLARTSQSIGGAASSDSYLGNVTLTGSSSKTFIGNATTSDLTIVAGSGTTTVPAGLTLGIAGDFTQSSTRFYGNNATFSFGSSSVAASQTISGLLTGEQALGDVVFTDASAKTFTSDASTTDFIIVDDVGTTTIPAGVAVSVGGDFANYGNLVGAAADYTFRGTEGVGVTGNTATTTAASLTVSSQDSADQGFTFKPDGMKLFYVGDGNDDVYAYNLTTPWDISTASYASQSYDLGSDFTNTQDIVFAPDGRTMYVADDDGNEVRQFTLSVAWDITSAATTTNILDTTSQATNVFGFTMKPDGTALYTFEAISGTGRAIYQYDMSVPWDLGSATYGSVSYTATDNNKQAITFNREGTYMYLLEHTVNNLEVYALSTPWDITTAAFAADMDILGINTSTEAQDIELSPDGTRLYILWNTLYEIPLDLAGQTLVGELAGDNALGNLTMTGSSSKTFLSNASTSDLTIVAGSGTTTVPAGVHISVSDDFTQSGTLDAAYATFSFGSTSASASQTLTGSLTGDNALGHVEFYGSSSKSLIVNASTTDFRIATGSGTTTIPAGVKLSVGGDFTQNGTFDGAYAEYTLESIIGAGYATSAVRFTGSTTAMAGTNHDGIFFSDDGQRVFAAAEIGTVATLKQYELTTPWDLTTLTDDGDTLSVETTLGGDFVDGMHLRPDGRAAYVSGGGDTLYAFILSTPWDVTSATFLASSSYTAITNNAFGGFSPDGRLVYFAGAGVSDGALESYELTTPWDITTLTNRQTLIDAALTLSPNSFHILPDGRSAYIVGYTGASTQHTLHYLTLTIPWDITTATISFMLDLEPYTNFYSTTATDIFVKPDGSRLFIFGNYFPRTAYQFDFSPVPQTLSGTLTGDQALGDVIVAGVGTTTFAANASTSNFTLEAGTTTLPSGTLSVRGDFTNNATFAHNNGTVVFEATSTVQIATGTLSGTGGRNSFNDLTVTNTSQNGTTSQSFILGTTTNIDGSFTLLASTSVQFPAGATTTIAELNFVGADGSPVWLRSSATGTPWNLDASTQTSVLYVDVRDSNACGSPSDISATNGTDSGNNTCWSFGGSPLLSSAANQVFGIGQATTSIATITFTEAPGAAAALAASDIRIVLSTTTTTFRFDTTDTTAEFGGTAAGKVSNPVSYEGDGSILVIPVDTNFAASDTLTISGLSFAQFTATSAPLQSIKVMLEGAGDLSAEATDDKTIEIRNSLTLADHTVGQLDDAFNSTNVVDGALFRFNLDPQVEDETISEIVFSLVGVHQTKTADFSNVALYRDLDNDGVVDAGETAVGGTGAVSISGQTGTITFSTSFSATTSQGYILEADVSMIAPREYLTVQLAKESITTVVTASSDAVVLLGSATQALHERNSRAAAGSSGGDAPTGREVVGGGEQSGGDNVAEPAESGNLIGNEVGSLAPSSTGAPNNDFTTPANAYASDGSYAVASADGDTQSYADFNFTIPGGNQIDGIVVKIEASGSGSASGTMTAYLSYNAGTNVSDGKTTGLLATSTETLFTLGGAGDEWGRSWTPSEFSNTNFRLRLVFNEFTGADAANIDAVQVKVYHSTVGGGGGGGGEIED